MNTRLFRFRLVPPRLSAALTFEREGPVIANTPSGINLVPASYARECPSPEELEEREREFSSFWLDTLEAVSFDREISRQSDPLNYTGALSCGSALFGSLLVFSFSFFLRTQNYSKPVKAATFCSSLAGIKVEMSGVTRPTYFFTIAFLDTHRSAGL